MSLARLDGKCLVVHGMSTGVNLFVACMIRGIGPGSEEPAERAKFSPVWGT
jgi:hypothetical protein